MFRSSPPFCIVMLSGHNEIMLPKSLLSPHVEWKGSEVVEEWTNGSEPHKRTFFQEYNATIVVREESGQAPGGPN